MLGLALLFTWLGVYDRGNSSPAFQFGMWALTISVGAITSVSVVPWVFYRRFADLAVPAQIALSTVMIAIPVTGALLVLETALGGAPPVSGWPLQFVYVLVITAMLTTAGYVVNRYHAAQTAAEDMPETDGVAAFLERLPLKYRSAELYAISSEDHYLRVHTDLGEELILMRLSDAVRELSGAPGTQTHRSWWVATSGVADVQRSNGKTLLVLKSGTQVPVSRTFAKQVKAAGLS